MATKRVCDRCDRSNDTVAVAVLTTKGIHRPEPAARHEPLHRVEGPDLCDDCLHDMSIAWGPT